MPADVPVTLCLGAAEDDNTAIRTPATYILDDDDAFCDEMPLPEMMAVRDIESSPARRRRPTVEMPTTTAAMDELPTPSLNDDNHMENNNTNPPPQNQNTQDEKRCSRTIRILIQIKNAGISGFIAYALWGLVIWMVAIPLGLLGYRGVTGHWPSITDETQVEEVGGEIWAFVAAVRPFTFPIRIGLTLATAPWIERKFIRHFRQGFVVLGSEDPDGGSGTEEEGDVAIYTSDGVV